MTKMSEMSEADQRKAFDIWSANNEKILQELRKTFPGVSDSALACSIEESEYNPETEYHAFLEDKGLMVEYYKWYINNLKETT